MSQSPPTTLGKYQIIREIARSNDIVYEAYDPVMNRRVAVKELALLSGASQQQIDERVKRFLREARAAGSLVHANVVTIYEVSEDQGRRYIAMEYLDGQNLRNLLDTKGFIEPNKAVEIAIEVLNGLAFAHDHGVIHRDVKPDNIQLLENGEVKLTDFGIARLTFEPNLTMDGQVFGTPSYMSPEQINGREIDARSDIFSVGVILYEMVAGQKPFTGDNVVAITHAIMNQDPPQPTQCGPALWQVIRQAIDKSPSLRWGGAKEMASALKAALAQMSAGDVVATPLPPPQSYSGVMTGPPPIHAPLYGSTVTPYGTPMPGAIHQAPYQPAALGQPYGQPPQAMGQPYGQPYIAPIPVYYPPPPRGPMVSAETRVFFGRLLKAFLLVGTIVALAVAAIVQGSKALSNTQPSAQPAATGSPQATRPAETVETLPTVSEAQAAVASAMEARDPTERRGLWSKASRLWATLASNGDQVSVNREAVYAFLTAADTMMQRGDNDGAILAVYEAQGFAQSDPTLSGQVQSYKAALGR